MTNTEAIEILTNVKNTPQITWTNGADIAFDLAIKALKNERPQGEWIDTGAMEEYWAEWFRCSACGEESYWEDFCPNCGADMRKETKNDTMHNM